MSNVTNVILSFSICEKGDFDRGFEIMEQVDAALQEATGSKQSFNGAEQIAGGSKHLERPTFFAAVNYANINGFATLLAKLPWVYPAEVQLFACPQDFDRYMLCYPCRPDGSGETIDYYGRKWIR